MAWGRVYGEGLLVDYGASRAAVYGAGLLVDYGASRAAVYGAGLLVDYGIVAGTPHAAVYGVGLLVDYHYIARSEEAVLVQGEFLLQDVQFQGSELWDGPGQIAMATADLDLISAASFWAYRWTVVAFGMARRARQWLDLGRLGAHRLDDFVL